MKRDPALVRLSWDHHHGLVFARRIAKELPSASDSEAAQLYSDLVAFWSAGLLPHFRAEGECLLARLVRHLPHESEPVVRLQRDHLSLEALVATMRDASDAGERRDALAAFGELLHDHIRWEERDLFEVTQQQLTPDEMAALGEQLDDELPPLEAAPAREN
jgi:hypothetical protein